MNVRAIAGWALSILGSLMFAFAGTLKLIGSSVESDGFRVFGLPIWFMYVVGVVEITGVVLLLFTKRPLIGAALLCVVGAGAAFEHLTHAQLGFAPIPLLLAAFAVAGALLRGARIRSRAIN
jgi:putative oxidoreductase